MQKKIHPFSNYLLSTICNLLSVNWPHRLAWSRMSASQAEHTGSNPVGAVFFCCAKKYRAIEQ